MADIVLVHGAWGGSWCWRLLLPLLWGAGHRVVTVTLTGLGERAHQLSPHVTLATHVQDVVTAVRAEECRHAVLVGHSYGGLVVTGAADRLADEVGPLVYLDAVVPTPGECWSTGNPPEVREQRRAAIERSGVIPPPDPSIFGLAGADAAWVERRLTPHPGGTYDDPLDFDGGRWAGRPRFYLSCTNPVLPTIAPFHERVRTQPGWHVSEYDAGHNLQITHPQELAAALEEVVAGR
ncbi:pimeloyl-ACP methyl ester carboxylesterase [Geodermatophilus bullaregiensis]|uniref:alpha/beta fold hydrolase n=1 Tax=Geodermatophilus bullaregiensis TaxID=1564160 RepID=UPI00195A754B|nr:alpha/beta hydrolase [Geodermatophilus bullaregiensis]MBM7804988.1 pimeloyl-ACP methyl ester carboxylesterase [Geodermatophilus bullaregiensis]